MHAIFMAKGPLFAKGKTLKPFNTVDLYNLFCSILHIKCKKNDGSERIEIWNDLFVGKVPSGSGDGHKKGKLQYLAELIRDRFRYFTSSRN